MDSLIGRKREVDELKRLYISKKSEFVAVYGRRRVGKTFLVDEALRGKITFRHAGLSPVDESGQSNNLKQQLLHFYLVCVRAVVPKVGWKHFLCWSNICNMQTMLVDRSSS